MSKGIAYGDQSPRRQPPRPAQWETPPSSGGGHGAEVGVRALEPARLQATFLTGQEGDGALGLGAVD
jgi:hypothetical protein